MRRKNFLTSLGCFCLVLVMALSLTAANVKPASAYMPAGELRWAWHTKLPPQYVDPATATGSMAVFWVCYVIHDALVKSMPNQLKGLSLAESWNMSPDGRVYEFKIRQGVKFHNGDTLTAEDVKFSFDRFRGMYAKTLHGKVDRVEIVNPYLIRFHLKQPWLDFMTFYPCTSTGANWIVPKKYVEAVGDKGFMEKPIGCGPYKFVKREPGKITFEAFEGYWRKVPHIKTLVFLEVPEAGTRLAMLQTGEIDIATAMKGPIADSLMKDPVNKFIPTYSTAVDALLLTEQWNPDSPWSKLKFRQAASLALDRETMVKATNIGAPVRPGLVPEEFEYALKLEPIPYDPKRAKQLLAEAGYPNGADAGTIFTDSHYTSIAESVATYWHAVGIKSKIRSIERAAFRAAEAEKRYKGVVNDVTGAQGNAATRIERALYQLVNGRYPELDALWEKQNKEFDPEKRTAILHEMQRFIYDNVVVIPLHGLSSPVGLGPRVKTCPIMECPQTFWPLPYEDIELYGNK